ncbi:MAG: hypothetical protein EBT79_06460 [Actinobacteria bacterium]|nr:hypothetical protein [Actinomycetota bacterium]NBR66911.1 hypothetical protein [Actinomycetota bacterium]
MSTHLALEAGTDELIAGRGGQEHQPRIDGLADDGRRREEGGGQLGRGGHHDRTFAKSAMTVGAAASKPTTSSIPVSSGSARVNSVAFRPPT